MRRYAYLLCFLAFCSNAHAALNSNDVIYDEETGAPEVQAFIRADPQDEAEQSEVFEIAPEEAMEEEPFLEFAKSSATPKEDAEVSENLSKKHKNKKQVRCVNSEGVASNYWQPQPVASGGRFDPNAMTAAHKTLPFGHKVRVTNLRNGKSVVVTINDRGPYTKGRIIDLSRASFEKIAPRKQGVAKVKIESVGCEG